MALIDRILDPPSYGWKDENNNLVVPTFRQLFSEFFSRLNIFRSRKNWVAFISWFWVIALGHFLAVFFIFFFSWKLFFFGFLYGIIFMAMHSTVWYHRYSTHQAFVFNSSIWRFITKNLVVKILLEEVYVVSHHVHHSKSEKPGDPYNAHGGGLYCFLADVNHQKISQNLSEKDYIELTKLLDHTGMYINSYEQYLKWGSVAHPAWSVLHWVLNWGFWYIVFFLIGGHALAFALFGGAAAFSIGIRTYNFEGHGKGKDKRQEGIDFNTKDLSINQVWPGYAAGEWHNNHHLFPKSARNGFLPYQLDLPWVYIYLLFKIGAIKSYRDDKQVFLEKYYYPYKKEKAAKKGSRQVI
ncbi:MAG: fatty acid desaturase [Bacteroidota bacterium]